MCGGDCKGCEPTYEMQEREEKVEVVLKYRLPDNKYELKCAMDGENMKSCLHELASIFRAKMKYCDDGIQAKVITYEEVYELFFDTCSGCGIDPFED